MSRSRKYGIGSGVGKESDGSHNNIEYVVLSEFDDDGRSRELARWWFGPFRPLNEDPDPALVAKLDELFKLIGSDGHCDWIDGQVTAVE